jgi:hypothetical protein
MPASEEALMVWYVDVAWFFAGAFLANAIPHILQGICGNRFQTPVRFAAGRRRILCHRQCDLGLFQFRDRRGVVVHLPSATAAAVAIMPRGVDRRIGDGAVAGKAFRQGT